MSRLKEKLRFGNSWGSLHTNQVRYVFVFTYTFYSGDCGFGYYKSIVLVTVLVAAAFVPNMAIMLSWVSMGSTGLLFVPLIYNNAFVIPAWILGVLAIIPGLVAANYSSYVYYFLVFVTLY